MTRKLNLQNLTKDAEFLDCFVADPGQKIVQLDFTALEPHVLCHFSQDPGLLGLFGPDAKFNDVYIYVAAQLKGIGEPFLELGYDPLNPDPAVIKRCKKELKPLRNVAKVIHLGCIAEGEMLRTRHRGLVPIEQIKLTDEIWNGERWVVHSGVIYKGIKEVISNDGIKATRDHKIQTESGWEVHERKHKQLIRPKKPSYTWTDLWLLGSYKFRSSKKRWIQICRSVLSPFKIKMDQLRQHKIRKK